MKPIVLWIVGAPGVGKTTIARTLIGALDQPSLYLVSAPKWTVTDDLCAAGHYTGQTFDGADTVPYNGAKACLEFWEKNLKTKPLTILDGDRFSNKGVMEWFNGKAIRCCAYFEACDTVRKTRLRGRGSKQNERWMQGRATKAKNFHGLFWNHLEVSHRLHVPVAEPWSLRWVVDEQHPADIARHVRDWLRGMHEAP